MLKRNMAFGQAQAHGRVIPGAVATEGVDVRREFLKKTYGHLAGAIAIFAGLCFLFTETIGPEMAKFAFGGKWNWLLILGAFMFVGVIADKWAHSQVSTKQQYFGLGLFVVAEALIFTPMLYVVATFAKNPNVIPISILATLILFGALTATVFVTKKDFSFLGNGLRMLTFGAMGVIVLGIIFGFNLGLFFSVAMVALMAGYVLYYTSAVLQHYRPTQHVAAALALFSAIATMFWYVIQIVMSLTSD